MSISHHIEQFHGLPVFDFAEAVRNGRDMPPASTVAWKIGVDLDEARSGGESSLLTPTIRSWAYGSGSAMEAEPATPSKAVSMSTFDEAWRHFLESVDTEQVTAIVTGMWFGWEPQPLAPVLAEITAAAPALPALRALFIGDITGEECEISWLEMCDITPVFTTFPGLTEFVVRGGSCLELEPVRHEHLSSLRFESGGLAGHVVRAVGECELPALTELDMWLGVEEYGGNHSLDDLAPLLTGTGLPALRRLGLQNTEYQDDVAIAVTRAPILPQLEHLALGMGTLGDNGAEALLDAAPFGRLRSLDLHHHYIGEIMQDRLRAALAGVELDLSEPTEELDPDYYRWTRYVSVAE